MPKIALRQSRNGNKDPVLNIQVTDHPSYLKDQMVFVKIEDALTKIERWLKQKTEQGSPPC